MLPSCGGNRTQQPIIKLTIPNKPINNIHIGNLFFCFLGDEIDIGFIQPGSNFASSLDDDHDRGGDPE
jgi:hypothetical protein